MKASSLAAVVMVVGLLILLVGPLLLGVLPTGTYWTEADEQQLGEARSAAHAATYAGEHGLPTDTEGKARLEATRAAYEVHNRRLKAAQSSRHWLRIGCHVVGLLLAAGGVLLYVRAKRAEPA